jgi:hypothetical protein
MASQFIKQIRLTDDDLRILEDALNCREAALTFNHLEKAKTKNLLNRLKEKREEK